jgi:hypothetical protein
MPEDFYKIGPSENRRFDHLGLATLDRDWARWPGEPSEDLRLRPQFNLFYDIGVHLLGAIRSRTGLRDVLHRGEKELCPVVIWGNGKSCASKPLQLPRIYDE